LDRETSGVLLFARDATTARALARARARGYLERTYLALVASRPPARGEITLALGPEPGHRTRQRAYAPDWREAESAADAGPGVPGDASSGASPRAYPAHTAYRVIQYGDDASLVAVWLHTGRTHQVRAHFAAIGHPLIGDDLYGGPESPHIARQALHAWRTRFRHPATGEPLTILSPLPADFRAAAQALQ
jgi:23S rRNA pseudouridine1911/1915/1917 synthase